INDSRAAIIAHLTHIHSYAPRTSAVQSVHDRYIDAWKRLLDGYRAIDAGFATGDYSKLAAGREALFAWRAAIRDVAADLPALADETGLARARETRGARSTQAREAGPRSEDPAAAYSPTPRPCRTIGPRGP